MLSKKIWKQTPDIFKKCYDNKNNIAVCPVGRRGLIRVELDANSDSKTFVSNLQSRAPLLVQKALYPDTEFPLMAKIYIMSSSGGILAHDRLEIDILALENTSSIFTTQAATKIYKMDKGYASQEINIYMHKGSYLEFIPEQIIPYASSRFYQPVNLKLEANSTAVYCEILSAGRMASGEMFDFDICFLQMAAYDERDNIIFADTLNIQPDKFRNYIRYAFGYKTILLNLYIITKTIDYKKLDHSITKVIKDQSIFGSCSALPNESGMIIRMLSDSVDEIKRFAGSVSSVVRGFVFG